MTSGANYPTEWRHVNQLSNTEVRQLSEDTYELRSASHTVKITKEAFNLYRTDREAFEKWLDDHNIEAVPRDDK